MQKELHQFALQAINNANFHGAQQALIKLLNHDPSFADGYFLLGVIEAELGTFSKATKLMEKAVSLQPAAEYYAHLAKCFAMMSDATSTYEAIEKAKSSDITDALTLDTIGVALSRLGDHEQAITFFKSAIEKKQTAAFFYNLGSSQTFAGLFDSARASYEKAIQLEPLFYQAHSSLSHLGGIDEQNNHVKRLKSVLGQLHHPDAKLHIAHALARELDALKQFDACFSYLNNAKAEKKHSLRYDFKQDKAIFDTLHELFSETSMMEDNQVHEHSDAEPIFVVGMPRSGTTLTERILTNQEQVHSAGELQEFGLALKKLTATRSRFIIDVETLQASRAIDYARLGHDYLNSLKHVVPDNVRFVDKMPLNVLYAGHIIKALPKAKLVCVIRNPMDTVWGNYKQLFSLNDPYYNYAFDQQDIARYYCHFVKLADMWQSKFPNNFKIVKYDELVTEPENVAKEMLAFCDLQFDMAMLDITTNTSAVATASSVQVRNKINTKSLGQWKNFSTHLSLAQEIFRFNDIE